jgi:IS5 family transposase
MKAHIGVDADSGLVHTLTTAANAHDITEAAALLHGAEEEVFADSGYRGAERREEVSERHPTARWNIAMMPSRRKALKDKSAASAVLTDALERLKAGIRAKVEHPFRVLKCQFGYRKVRYRGLAKNTAQLQTLCALSNLWMVRKRILQRARA